MTADEIKVIHSIFTSYEAIVDGLLKLAKNHSTDSAKVAEINGLEAERKLMSLNMYEQLSPKKKGRPSGTIKIMPDKADVPFCIQAVRETIKRFPNKDLWDSIIEACNGKPEDTMEEDMAYFFHFWKKISGNTANYSWLLDWYRNNYLPMHVARQGDERPEHRIKGSNGFKKQGQSQPIKEEPLTNEDSDRIAAIIAKRGIKANT